MYILVDIRGNILNYGDWAIIYSSSCNSFGLAQYTNKGFLKNLFGEEEIYGAERRRPVIKIDTDLLQVYDLMKHYLDLYRTYKNEARLVWMNRAILYNMTILNSLKKEVVKYGLVDKQDVSMEIFNRKLTPGDMVYTISMGKVHLGVWIAEDTVLTDYLRVMKIQDVYLVERDNLTDKEEFTRHILYDFWNSEVYKHTLEPGNLYVRNNYLYLYLGNADFEIKNVSNNTYSLFQKSNVWVKLGGMLNNDTMDLMDIVSDRQSLIGLLSSSLRNSLYKNAMNRKPKRVQRLSNIVCDNNVLLDCLEEKKSVGKSKYLGHIDVIDGIVCYESMRLGRVNNFEFGIWVK